MGAGPLCRPPKLCAADCNVWANRHEPRKAKVHRPGISKAAEVVRNLDDDGAEVLEEGGFWDGAPVGRDFAEPVAGLILGSSATSLIRG